MENRRFRAVNEPIDPDVGPPLPERRPRRARVPWSVVAVVALGGSIGASARYGASLLWPTASGAFPWTTLAVNVVGCAVIGVFMVVISDLWAAHRLVRPFFGTGVLGGFTTFSTYAVDIQRLVDTGDAPTGIAYLGLTLLAALAAVWSAVWATRRVVAWRQS
ncbi:fluoride efflux transporter CrcB [Streptomyces sp. AK02-01A]|uniref:fluoride efflux transporter CrcB n=1 Tax=Streptomyces sp. AK02-01A TaxID=3028648 RepID=UPI0029A10278|nr:fluoride efflux transporter CrcB [Streptomyces sp. AK02-01A]MDX3855478.1 fluoride efflux transporter CrcB [Streptomyces sp. AK02-01A]